MFLFVSIGSSHQQHILLMKKICLARYVREQREAGKIFFFEFHSIRRRHTLKYVIHLVYVFCLLFICFMCFAFVGSSQQQQRRSSCIANALNWTNVVQSLNSRVQRGIIANSLNDSDPLTFLNRCQVPFQLKLFELFASPSAPAFKIFAQLECRFMLERRNPETGEIVGEIQPIFLNARAAVVTRSDDIGEFFFNASLIL